MGLRYSVGVSQMTSKIKTSYQGLIVTQSYVQVHFNVGNGTWMRHEHVKIPLSELLTDEVTQAMDRHVRRRLIEIWSQQEVPSLLDDQPPWGE